MPTASLLSSASNMFGNFNFDMERVTGLKFVDDYMTRLNQLQSEDGTINWTALDTEEARKTAKVWGREGLLHLATYSKLGVDAAGLAMGVTGNIPVMAALTLLGEVIESTIKSYADGVVEEPLVKGDWVLFDKTNRFRRRVFGEDNLDYWTLEE